jgi:poly(hydroxyalkanoate) depolymerase family esterase
MKSYQAFRDKHGFDATAVIGTIKRALASAGLDTAAGPLKGVTDTIEDALSTAGLMPCSAPANPGTTFDGTAREVDAVHTLANASPDRQAANVEPTTTETPRPQPGGFLQRSFTSAVGTRAYKVYLPAGYSARSSDSMPMVVMLHGCTQDPDDFAAGTRMNALADEHGFIAVYPAQSTAANAQKCWNWFRPEDQRRDGGEPAIIAGITSEVASTYRIDPRRIFVAGMSAGAAMAVILATTYPDLYAAVGAHSGLAYGVAHDVPSAFRAMRAHDASASSAPRAPITVPAIVFHGDKDRTVNPGNAAAIVRHCVAEQADSALHEEASRGTAAGGRRFSRKVYADAQEGVLAEHWVVHGAGHAWSGGSAAGTFTDAAGPDASKEMIRFFLNLPRAGTS